VFLDALDDAVFVQEVHLVLRGMDVHVDVLRSDLQTAARRKQKGAWPRNSEGAWPRNLDRSYLR